MALQAETLYDTPKRIITLVHVATRTVSSTCGCMHKGVVSKRSQPPFPIPHYFLYLLLVLGTDGLFDGALLSAPVFATPTGSPPRALSGS